MASREIVIGGIEGRLIAIASAWQISETRRRQIEHVNDYQHKQEAADTTPFLAVYSQDEEVAANAAGEIYNNYAIFPEMTLGYLSVERVIVTENILSKPLHFVKGLVMFRHDNGTVRVWVELTKHFAENGNNYLTNHVCHYSSEEEEKKVDQLIHSSSEEDDRDLASS